MKVEGTYSVCLLLLVACTGGQTGQDDTGGSPCPHQPESIPPETDVRGVIPLEAALAVEGTYVSPLVWSDGDETTTDPADDEVTVGLAYEDGPARLDACGRPQIEMSVQISTRDSGIEEHETVWMDTYPLVPDPIISPEFGITLPSYSRVSLSLGSGPVYAGVYAYEVPSGIIPTGSITVDAANDRYAYFPAREVDCIGATDPSALNPSPEGILNFLNGLSPEDFAWQGPGILPDRVRFRVDAPGCDEFGIGRVPVVTEVTFPGSDPIVLIGELTLAHRAEDPEVAAFLLSSNFTGSLEPPSVMLGDGSSCSVGAVNLALQAVRLPSEETPFDVIQASTHVGCAEDGPPVPPNEIPPPTEF